MQVITGKRNIDFARLATLKGMLRLEIAGMRQHGASAYSILKDMGYKGNREQVLEAVQNDIDQRIFDADLCRQFINTGSMYVREYQEAEVAQALDRLGYRYHIKKAGVVSQFTSPEEESDA